MAFARPALVALLALGPTPAAAQQEPAGIPVSVAQRPAPSGGGFEFGALSSVALIVPAFGGQVSVPVGRRVHVEVSAEIAPWLLEDSDDFWLASQIQLRLPLQVRPRVRRSLVVGVSSFTVFDGWSPVGRRTSWDWEAFVRPHAGVSWQWQRSARVDVRLDVQGVITGTTAPFVVPRVAFSTVWRTQGGRL